jgi:hypothetical protein
LLKHETLGVRPLSTQRSMLVEGDRLAKGEMPTNSKETKGVGKALINAFGLISFLFGSLVLVAIVFGMIGGIFMSKERLFSVKRARGDKEGFWEMGRAVDRKMKREKNGLS